MRSILIDTPEMQHTRPNGKKFSRYRVYWDPRERDPLQLNLVEFDHSVYRPGDAVFTDPYKGRKYSELYEAIDKKIPGASATIGRRISRIVDCYGNNPNFEDFLHTTVAETPIYKLSDCEVNFSLYLTNYGWELYFGKNYYVDSDGWTIHSNKSYKGMMDFIIESDHEHRGDEIPEIYPEIQSQAWKLHHTLTQ